MFLFFKLTIVLTLTVLNTVTLSLSSANLVLQNVSRSYCNISLYLPKKLKCFVCLSLNLVGFCLMIYFIGKALFCGLPHCQRIWHYSIWPSLRNVWKYTTESDQFPQKGSSNGHVCVTQWKILALISPGLKIKWDNNILLICFSFLNLCFLCSSFKEKQNTKFYMLADKRRRERERHRERHTERENMKELKSWWEGCV